MPGGGSASDERPRFSIHTLPSLDKPVTFHSSLADFPCCFLKLKVGCCPAFRQKATFSGHQVLPQYVHPPEPGIHSPPRSPCPLCCPLLTAHTLASWAGEVLGALSPGPGTLQLPLMSLHRSILNSGAQSTCHWVCRSDSAGTRSSLWSVADAPPETAHNPIPEAVNGLPLHGKGDRAEDTVEKGDRRA